MNCAAGARKLSEINTGRYVYIDIYMDTYIYIYIHITVSNLCQEVNFMAQLISCRNIAF